MVILSLSRKKEHFGQKRHSSGARDGGYDLPAEIFLPVHDHRARSFSDYRRANSSPYFVAAYSWYCLGSQAVDARSRGGIVELAPTRLLEFPVVRHSIQAVSRAHSHHAVLSLWADSTRLESR